MKISVPEAAKLAGISVNIVNALIKAKDLVVIKETPDDGGRVRQYLDDAGVYKLSTFARAYHEGYSSEAAIRIASEVGHHRYRRNRQLNEALSTILSSCFYDDIQKARDVLLDQARKLLSVECVLLFTNGCMRPHRYSLDAASGTVGTWEKETLERFPPLPAEIVEEWREHRKNSNRPVSLYGDGLGAARFPKYFHPSHLPSGSYHSLMAVPLSTRKQHLFGFLVAINRTGQQDVRSAMAVFDVSDEVAGEALGHIVERGSEIQPALQQTRELLESLHANPKLSEFFGKILEAAIVGTGSQRGDLAWWSDGQLLVVAQRSDVLNQSKIQLGAIVPEPSLMRMVFETRRAAIMPNRKAYPFCNYYFHAWDKTASELAIPLLVPGNDRPLGVLNLEAQYEGFFDSKDLATVSTIAQHGALYAALIESRSTVYQILSTAAEKDREPRENPLEATLRDIEQRTGFRAILLYAADYREAQLNMVAARGRNIPEGGYWYSFDEQALASKVFRENAPYFCANADADQFVADRGRRDFDVHGPVVVVPLRFGQTVVGVLVAWDKKKKLGAPPSEFQDLEHYGPLVVGSFIDLGMIKVMEEFRRLQDRLLERALEIEPFVHDVLRALGLFFKHARVWRYEKDGSKISRFCCVDSVGVGETDGKYRGQVLLPESSKYTEFIGELAPQAIAFLLNPDQQFGPAPEAVLLDRPVNAPWAVYPLYAAGERLGHVACDNYQYREITPRDREVMALFGSLLAQAIDRWGWPTS
ncbi:MAG: GAF domain-containing protein [Bryobacterales bacterium]|nr:GAF domain-containing protein [Bryobacterales bacterium]